MTFRPGPGQELRWQVVTVDDADSDRDFSSCSRFCNTLSPVYRTTDSDPTSSFSFQLSSASGRLSHASLRSTVTQVAFGQKPPGRCQCQSRYPTNLRLFNFRVAAQAYRSLRRAWGCTRISFAVLPLVRAEYIDPSPGPRPGRGPEAIVELLKSYGTTTVTRVSQ